MRVVLVDPASFTPLYDHALASALADRGHEVCLLTSPYRFGPAPRESGFRREERLFPLTERLLALRPHARLHLAVRAFEYGPSGLRLLRRTRELDPDVVHVQWLPAPRFDLVWLRALTRRWRTLITAHDVVPARRRHLAAWGRAVRSVERVLVHSRRGAETLVGLGVAAGRVEFLRFPVSRPAYPRPSIRRDRAMLLFFGFIRPRKGLDILVRALPEVARAVPSVRLAIAGAPVASVAATRALAEELGVASRIEWRLGFLSEELIAELMSRSSVVVLPYRRGATSGVLATAFGYGRPAVVSDVGGLGELVYEFEAGRVVPPSDVSALAAACTELLADARGWSIAAAGADAAARECTWERAAAEHERIYAKVIGGSLSASSPSNRDH